jgi:hypothetical protein
MSRVATLAGLSLRELWISFRLLACLAAFAAAGALVAVAPGQPWGWFALGVAAAMAVGAGLIAGAVAGDRRRGFAGWLVARAVPRPSLVAGWLVAGSVPLVAGLAIAGAAATILTTGPPATAEAAVALPLPLLAVAATVPAAVGLAMIVGLVAPPRLAELGTALLVVGWLLAVVLLLPATTGLPGAGLAMLADPVSDPTTTAIALRAAGTSLALGGVVWAVAIAVAGRVDL